MSNSLETVQIQNGLPPSLGSIIRHSYKQSRTTVAIDALTAHNLFFSPSAFPITKVGEPLMYTCQTATECHKPVSAPDACTSTPRNLAASRQLSSERTFHQRPRTISWHPSLENAHGRCAVQCGKPTHCQEAPSEWLSSWMVGSTLHACTAVLEIQRPFGVSVSSIPSLRFRATFGAKCKRGFFHGGLCRHVPI